MFGFFASRILNCFDRDAARHDGSIFMLLPKILTVMPTLDSVIVGEKRRKETRERKRTKKKEMNEKQDRYSRKNNLKYKISGSLI